ncbi:electron transfer flavoprotein subunit beta/FixA family protein [Actinoplanes sp. KI2]|uniref:electron transfer flavoprotein subunit beta/FixA family protein n=1 Tax=Actinoplanes sp. KI2 TaxID=2983315 RepID=UPI0021D5D22A|nr:electron transfer flavoprotein subunit beta/FixA family protein [Actinoplanes sp. KI2]MCU7729475.1 electron transfer flavoprotein subunit beta/FixA family protein [Actinoplanes sp. KI2]
MKIVVLVKHVPEPTAGRYFAGDRTLDREHTEGGLSELDEYAVEQAVRLTEAGVATEVGYLTMGPARAVDALRRALAMGGTGATHLLDDRLHGTDAVGTSLVLAAALRRIGFDLVLCGMASTDAEMSVVPVMVAERLAVPAVTNVVALSADGSAVTARRDTGDATEEVTAPLPALVTVTDRAGEARLPSFKGIVAAKKRPITTWSLADLGIEPERVGAAAAGTLVRAIKPRPPREAGTVVTDEGDAAARLADFLVANKLL